MATVSPAGLITAVAFGTSSISSSFGGVAGNLVAGWQLARALLVAQTELKAGVDAGFMTAKIVTARFYADHILSKAPGIRDSIVDGAESVTALALDAF